MKKSEAQVIAGNYSAEGRSEETPLIRKKIELCFIEKSERERPHPMSGYIRRESQEMKEEDVLQGSTRTNNEMGRKFDFGIGELAEEFAALSSLTPPPSPAPFSNTSESKGSNDGKSAAVSLSAALSGSVSMSITPPSRGLLPTPLPKDVPLVNFANVASVVPMFSPPYRPPNVTKSISTNNCNSGNPQGSRTTAISTNNSSLASISVSSPSNKPPMQPRPRLVRRFLYWCRVLEMRRRNPMCRYCYERYAHMCMDSRQPVPGPYDRGLWHGHNMREHGLVTCPHLWFTTCPHCGASKQYAHTSDYCPLVRKNYTYPRTNNHNF